MYRIVARRLALLMYCLTVASIALLFFSGVSLLPAYAAGNGNPQVSITFPMVNGSASGHPGTQVTFSGSGFSSGTGNLYTTTNSDPTKCTNAGSPGNLGLTPFSTHPTVFIKGDGTFTVQSTWPNNAANANASYYICVIKRGSDALSTNTFTVVPPATVAVTPTTVAPGGQVTITGSNWLPPQLLTISIVAGNSNGTPLVKTSVSSASNGNLSTPLTIPATAPQGTYSIVVVAQNETTMNATASNMLTVTAPTATPSPSASPSPTTTPSVTPSPTLTPTQLSSAPTATPTGGSDTSGSGGISNAPALFTLIGIGAMLLVVGSILFVVYGKLR